MRVTTSLLDCAQVLEDDVQLLLVMDFEAGGPVLSRGALQAGRRIPEDLARLYFRDMLKAREAFAENAFANICFGHGNSHQPVCKRNAQSERLLFPSSHPKDFSRPLRCC